MGMRLLMKDWEGETGNETIDERLGGRDWE